MYLVDKEDRFPLAEPLFILCLSNDLSDVVGFGTRGRQGHESCAVLLAAVRDDVSQGGLKGRKAQGC